MNTCDLYACMSLWPSICWSNKNTVKTKDFRTAIRTAKMDYAIAKHYKEANHGPPSSLRFNGLEEVIF